MKKPTIIIGMGTGRSGTKSLARLLMGCEGAHVTHEHSPLLPWELTEDAVERAIDYVQRLPRRAGCAGKRYIGDVSQCWLRYVPALRKAFDGIRFLAIMRPKEETVDSFLRHMPDATTSERSGGHWQIPTYDLSPEEGLRRYWETYTAEVQALGIPTVPTHALNTDQRVIFDRAGIEPQDRTPRRVHVNRSVTTSL